MFIFLSSFEKKIKILDEKDKTIKNKENKTIDKKDKITN
jgi:hypothetical protein